MAKEVKQWITINGTHVPIFEGESKEDAVKRATKKQQENVKKNESDKEKQIAKNKAEKDQMNNKKDSGKVLKEANDLIEERNRVLEKHGFDSPEYKALKEKIDKFQKENKVSKEGSGKEVDKVRGDNETKDIASRKYTDIKKDLDVMKSKDLVEYTYRADDGETVKEIYARQANGSYKMHNGFGEHEDSDYLADYMKQNGGSYKILGKNEVTKQKTDSVTNLNDLQKNYSFGYGDKAKDKKIIDEVEKIGRDLPDGTVLARVKQETSSNYTSRGIYSRTETKVDKMYKINGRWSRYSDGSGKIDNFSTSVLHNEGKLMTLKQAEREAKKLSATDHSATKYYGAKEKWNVHVPDSFAANYPNLSATQLKAKYKEFLEKNRK